MFRAPSDPHRRRAPAAASTLAQVLVLVAAFLGAIGVGQSSGALPAAGSVASSHLHGVILGQAARPATASARGSSRATRAHPRGQVAAERAVRPGTAQQDGSNPPATTSESGELRRPVGVSAETSAPGAGVPASAEGATARPRAPPAGSGTAASADALAMVLHRA